MDEIKVIEQINYSINEEGILILPEIGDLEEDTSFYVKFGGSLSGLFVNKTDCEEFKDVLNHTVSHLKLILLNNSSNDPSDSLLKYRIEKLMLLSEGLEKASSIC